MVANHSGYFENKLVRLQKIKDTLTKNNVLEPKLFTYKVPFVISLIRNLDGKKSSILYLENAHRLSTVFYNAICLEEGDLSTLVDLLTAYDNFDYHKNLISIFTINDFFNSFNLDLLYMKSSLPHVIKAIQCLNNFYHEHETIEPVAAAVEIMAKTYVDRYYYRIRIADLIIEAINFLERPTIEDQSEL